MKDLAGVGKHFIQSHQESYMAVILSTHVAKLVPGIHLVYIEYTFSIH